MYLFHPLTVHLPVGLLLGHAVLIILYLRSGDTTMERGAYHCLWLGWCGTVLAIATGAIDATRQLFATPEPRSDAVGWINAHALVGIAILIVYWQLWQMHRRQPDLLAERKAHQRYLMLMGMGVVLVMLDGWLGGYLVYRLRLGITH